MKIKSLTIYCSSSNFLNTNSATPMPDKTPGSFRINIKSETEDCSIETSVLGSPLAKSSLIAMSINFSTDSKFMNFIIKALTSCLGLPLNLS